MRKAAVGVAAVGALAVVGGIVFGTQGKNAEKQSDALCPTTSCNDPRGVQLNSDARSDALRANIAFAVGGVAIAGAAVMWFVGAPRVAHDTVAVTPVIEPSGAGFAIAGRF